MAKLKKIFFVALISLMGVVFFTGCDVGTNEVTESLDKDTSEVVNYVIDTADVDYKNDNNVIYYDFSSGTKTVLAHNTWHIAFNKDLFVIANSGNYGSGVSVCSTGITDFATDFTSWYSDTTKSFTRIDTNSNVLGHNWMDLSSMPPSYTGNVYLLKTDAGNFKIQFTGAGMGGTVDLRIATGEAAAADTVTYTQDSEYEYTYINCETKEAVMVAPKITEWDLRFGRTEFAMGANTGGKSSVVINSKGGVEVASVDGQDIANVLETASLSFSSDILAIGEKWYTFDHDSKTFSVNQKTYVFKTTEGNFAKMQMATFYGPNSEGFWSIFQYLYQADGSLTFGK